MPANQPASSRFAVALSRHAGDYWWQSKPVFRIPNLNTSIDDEIAKVFGGLTGVLPCARLASE